MGEAPDLLILTVYFGQDAQTDLSEERKSTTPLWAVLQVLDVADAIERKTVGVNSLSAQNRRVQVFWAF